jgi:hypothetical protein
VIASIRQHAIVCCLGIAAALSAQADVITDWNQIAVDAGYKAGGGNAPHARAMAIMHLAMFEAVNSIEPRYTPYRGRLQADPGASADAAAAVAAHHVLKRIYPQQAPSFEAELLAALNRSADGEAKAAGVRLGEQAAAAMLAERANDGSTAADTYRPFTLAGSYVPTTPPLFTIWGRVRPFAMKSADALRPAPPYALDSVQWARDYNEIKTLGAKNGSSRTPEQTEIARFWALSGPATYNPVTRQVSAAKGLDLLDNARLFALSSMAAADAAIAIFDAKYAYGFWRPVTAIRNGDVDGNSATERDAGWEPLIATPMHPEYPCAHCIFQGSAAAVLRAQYGDVVPPFKLSSSTAPGVVRSYERLSDYVAEVVNGRIYEGVHYRASGEVGAEMGRQLGEYVVATQLRPLQSKGK